MKNFFKKLGVFVLAAATILPISACGPSDSDAELPAVEIEDWKDESVSGSLGIRLWKGGFGSLWLENVAAGFQQHYPNVKVTLKASEERKTVYSEVCSGLANDYDVYFSESVLTDRVDVLEDLSDVYSYKWENEDKTIGEKINPTVAEACTVRGVKYMVPSYSGGMYGLVYNTQWIEDFPVTTDGMKDLCNTLKDSAVTPIVFGQCDYWNYAYSVWFAQYEGLDTYLNAQSGKNAQGEVDPTVSCLQGGLKSMQAVEDFLWYQNGNIATDSSGLQFIIAQRKFLKEEKAAMICAGSWMMTEMSRHVDGNYEFKMAKFPVISAIIEKCTTIADDAELTALVKAIDAGATALSGEGYEVNQADFDKVKEARSLVYSSGDAATGVITKAAQNKENAKLFLKYLYSAEGIKLMAQSQCGAVLPVVGYDFSKDLGTIDAKKQSFLTSAYELISNSYVFFNDTSAAIRPYYTNTGETFEVVFGSKNSKDRKRATELFNDRQSLWAANGYSKFYEEMNRAGLLTSAN